MIKRVLSFLLPIKIHQKKSVYSKNLEVTWNNGYLVLDSENTNYSFGSLQRVLKKGLKYIYDQLVEIDPNIKEKIDENNTNRVIRAFEIYRLTNESPLKHLSNFYNQESLYDYLYIVINQ